MRILLVKLSSLGDVIHNLPVVGDIHRVFPDAVVDWVTEAAYAPLVARHPGIRSVFPVHLRDLKKNWWRPANWSCFFDDKARLTTQHYDHIIDTQGLLKSALVAGWSNGTVAGFDRDSAREPLAARGYDQLFAVTRDAHAVTRNRTLAARALQYAMPTGCDYGLAVTPVENPEPYVVFIHASSRADKGWDTASWLALGRLCNMQGWQVVLPAGNADELARGTAIAAGLTHARAIAPLPLTETAALIAGATGVVGVDTGLAHLAVALGCPTVGIYLTTQPALTGLYDGNPQSTRAVNLGGGTRTRPAVVAVDDAWQALEAANV